MSQMAPIQLFTTVPADATNYILKPQGVQGNMATYLATAEAIPVGQPRLTVSLTRASPKSKYSRVRIRYVVPTLKLDANNQQVLSHQNFADLTFTFAENSTETERVNIATAMEVLLAGACLSGGLEIDDLVTKLDMPY